MEALSPEQRDLLKKRLERIVSAGAKMRVAQNDYFRNRGPITLQVAKSAEWAFDALIKEENKALQTKQQDLF